jgi:hypothetical protein
MLLPTARESVAFPAGEESRALSILGPMEITLQDAPFGTYLRGQTFV